MSKTLLDGVNDVLDRVGILDSNGELASLSNQGKQLFIDLAVQIWNETIDEMCNMMGTAHVGEPLTEEVALEEGDRENSLPDDLVQIRWPLICEENGYYIWEYPGGYEQMRIDQPMPDEWVGLPQYAAINPVSGNLRFDRIPDAASNGLEYILLYDQDTELSDANHFFPFSDATYRAVLPVVAEGWERRKRNDFDLEEYRKHLARAVAFANKTNRRTHW